MTIAYTVIGQEKRTFGELIAAKSLGAWRLARVIRYKSASPSSSTTTRLSPTSVPTEPRITHPPSSVRYFPSLLSVITSHAIGHVPLSHAVLESDLWDKL